MRQVGESPDGRVARAFAQSHDGPHAALEEGPDPLVFHLTVAALVDLHLHKRVAPDFHEEVIPEQNEHESVDREDRDNHSELATLGDCVRKRKEGDMDQVKSRSGLCSTNHRETGDSDFASTQS